MEIYQDTLIDVRTKLDKCKHITIEDFDAIFKKHRQPKLKSNIKIHHKKCYTTRCFFEIGVVIDSYFSQYPYSIQSVSICIVLTLQSRRTVCKTTSNIQ